MEQFGEVLGDILASAGDPRSRGASLLLLSGSLGAGKTTLVRGLAHGVGSDPRAVSSPTFTIRMDHAGGARPLVHIDAWRLAPDDLPSIGFDELLASDAIVAIEWPERIHQALPPRAVLVAIEHAEPIEDGAEPGRVATVSEVGLPSGESRRLAEGLALLVRAPRIAPPSCPTCGAPLDTEGSAESIDRADRPFCSRRCRLADLGDWLLMRHRIAGSSEPEVDES
jgi:tRNA threonylcarbamoyladenosine biosynthesis protein TsaE